ncbi:hypothetical protein [Brucella intermedia]|uniref:hypothetical protein n=1 Tax=Brucella intermedia TaxID=94625 RepID=UPI00158FD0C6|nr:hypothetical protein [Brucella intermedia]
MTVISEEAVKALPRAPKDQSDIGWTLPIHLLEELRKEADGWADEISIEGVEAIALSTERRILSALEPSAARELALEEGYRQGIEAAAQKAAEMLVFADTTSTADREIPAAIRTLSSPDHADAGKVEGDGAKWPIREVVAKAIAYHAVGDPHARTIRGDQRWEWFTDEADKFISVFGCYLPSAPSQEAAGS